MTKQLKRAGAVRARVVGDLNPPAPQVRRLRAFKMGEGLPSLPELELELLTMNDVLMGRADPPMNAGAHTLQEVADAYYARASEITMLLQGLERKGQILKGSGHYLFRTGELRTFREIASHASDMGSRRLTWEQLQFEMEQTGRESKGYRS